MQKRIITLGLAFALVTVLTGCGTKTNNQAGPGGQLKKPDSNADSEKNACYQQCEEWGGGAENVSMCKKNCDASSDPNSVWNEDENKYNEEDNAGNGTAEFNWQDEMPAEVPEFTYGNFTGKAIGMGSWIIDFDNVSADALEKYKVDLEGAGWTATIVPMANMMTGKYTSTYSISVNHDKESSTLQIIVRKLN